MEIFFDFVELTNMYSRYQLSRNLGIHGIFISECRVLEIP